MRILAFMLLLLTFSAAPATAQGGVCTTPDGFVFANRKGIGGTGTPQDKGIGGTGTYADIGVYGRITGFGSICVNGVEIEYADDTPVEGSASGVSDLEVGQVVAIRAYSKDDQYVARAITIDNILSGPISRIDEKRGELTILKQKVLVGAGNEALLKTLKKGDFVEVSGLRRADGVIVAGHVKESSAGTPSRKPESAAPFGDGVKAFSLQGYVRDADRGRLHLADGTEIVMPPGQQPGYNERVIVFGKIDDAGTFIADQIIPEQADFPATGAAPANAPGEDGKPAENGNGGADAPGLPGDNPALPLEVPALPIDVPALPVDVPELPLDLPEIPVEVPPVPEIPVIPEIPEPPLAPPDIPLPGN